MEVSKYFSGFLEEVKVLKAQDATLSFIVQLYYISVVFEVTTHLKEYKCTWKLTMSVNISLSSVL